MIEQETQLITVYITNYNYARFLRQSIESVLKQTLSRVEILIIDDGSTDNSREIIESYAKLPRIKTIYQQNRGLNITNNIAMRAACGKYIMRLDADDFLEPTALQEMYDILESDAELGLVFPDYYYVDAEGFRTGEERRHNFQKEVSLYDQPAHGACTMIRLSFLKALGGYNESFTCQDGYDLWIKFITHHKVANINKPLFSYRRHGTNLTTDESKILETRKKIKDLFVSQYHEKPQSLAVIPVRNTFIGKVNWPLLVMEDGKSILEKKVETCLAVNSIKAVSITTSDDDIFDHASAIFRNVDRVFVIRRPREFAGPNETLERTLQLALAEISEKGISVDTVISVSLEYPFLTADVIDDAVNSLVLFQSDSVLSVRPDNHLYYQHTGHSLKPILDQDKFTKLEREALYKGAGGVVVARVNSFETSGKMISGRVSHVVVDQKNAFGVFGPFDLQVFRALTENMKTVKQS